MRSLLAALAGLFFDDGWLAMAVIAIVAAAAVLALLVPAAQAVTGAILLIGCPGVLVANIIRATRKT